MKDKLNRYMHDYYGLRLDLFFMGSCAICGLLTREFIVQLRQFHSG